MQRTGALHEKRIRKPIDQADLVRDRSIAVGIDCGKSMGIAAWDRKARGFCGLITVSFWEGIEHIDALEQAAARVRFVVEDVSGVKAIFGRNRDRIIREIRKGKIHKAIGTIDRIGQRVGMNKREAELVIGYIERRGYAIDKRSTGNKGQKPDQESFKRWTRYPFRTNEHERDAGWMVYDM